MISREYSAPSIMTGHIDGPVLTYSDGQMHWLTWRERIAVAVGMASARSIQAKRRPDIYTWGKETNPDKWDMDRLR
jgi:hypothetical protein